MSQDTGINMFASGDYIFDDRQRDLFNTIGRLQAHMISLKDKLQEEKMLLSELKAETQYLSMQRATGPVLEDYKRNNIPTVPSTTNGGLGYFHRMDHAGDTGTEKELGEPKMNLDRFEYVHKLKEIDSLCKEEMSRVSSVAEQLEPLKQKASDWMLENRLSTMCAQPVLARGVSAVRDNDGSERYVTQPGPEPMIYNGSVSHFDCSSGLMVLPHDQVPMKTVFVAEGKCEIYPNINEADIEQKFDFQPPSKIESESKVEVIKQMKELSKSDIHSDSSLKELPLLLDNTKSKLDQPTTEKEHGAKPLTSNSEVNVTSPEFLKEENTLQLPKSESCTTSVEETITRIEPKDLLTTESVCTLKSAISLESIQRAFADHKKKKHDFQKKEHKIRLGAFDFVNGNSDVKFSFRKNEGNKDKIAIRRDNYPDVKMKPSARNIMNKKSEKEKKDKPMSQKSSQIVFSGSRKKQDDNQSLCEDDVINKFLYDEEGYVYTPLFVSENERDSSDEM